ncbi:mRNA (2'-O-methyladenosine-N(6)-)-methyltransferase [Malassezia yamatoensis]|uniref:mRNA m(6)A methyltransferase n=1 Tax=Malassezia yamatoensis TaxID=253288 RepID=A0AAJ5YUR0_9BASI|nr:mRNA (2'-O-methyladenosine-N(6)-)-methyltransferase [Malassezia yamatoensis]
MSLPYGTLSDEQMYALKIPQLQKQGLLFLWVTGRAMELGRALLNHWGYLRMDELVWVKINQLHRLIRTGRTGHWLNHTKEHCLVGYKSLSLSQTNAPPPGMYLPLPEWMHRGLGNDVIVAPVRDTSRKPDELYTMIEKMCPGGRFIELFGRQHNVRPKWLTLGNQLQGNNLPTEDTPLLGENSMSTGSTTDSVCFPAKQIDEILHGIRCDMLPIDANPRALPRLDIPSYSDSRLQLSIMKLNLNSSCDSTRSQALESVSDANPSSTERNMVSLAGERELFDSSSQNKILAQTREKIAQQAMQHGPLSVVWNQRASIRDG